MLPSYSKGVPPVADHFQPGAELEQFDVTYPQTAGNDGGMPAVHWKEFTHVTDLKYFTRINGLVSFPANCGQRSPSKADKTL